MADEIVERVDGGLSVRNKDGRFQKVPTPIGFTDSAFRNIVAAFDTAYRLHGRVPDLEEVRKVWPRVPAKTYGEMFLTEEFKQALSYRGIDWDPESGLSEEQQMVLLKLSDWTDRRSLQSKLKEMGVPFARYEAWGSNPLFTESLKQRRERQFEQANHIAFGAILAGADAGKIDAAKLLLEITGRWNPQQMQLEDARRVVMAVIEAVIKYTDAPTREKIMSEVEVVAGTLGAIHQQRVLEA